MLIRSETDADADATRNDTVATRAFKPAAHASGSEAQIVRLLCADDALQLSLVAEENGVIVGHVAVLAARIGDEAGWSLFGPLAVVPDRRAHCFATRLFRWIHPEERAGDRSPAP